MKSLSILTALLGLASATAIRSEPRPKRTSYDGYKVIRVAAGDDAAKLNKIIADLDLETWKGAAKVGGHADVVIPPTKLAAFKAQAEGFETLTMHEDLGVSISNESGFQAYAGSADQTWFNSYHAYADHLTFLNDLVAAHSNQSEIVTSGTSNNGNAITGIRFWGSAGKGVKPAIVFHGTVHAREWITTMVAEYQAWYLLNNYGSDATVKSLVDKYEFYIFPIVNPDGFIFTQTTTRLWRKNRQTNSGSSCIGRDINRNWPIQWSVSGGASTSPCDEDYKGAKQSDAPETTALAATLNKIKAAQGLKLFIDWHSYSQLFMSPYGYTCTAFPAKNTEYQALAKGAVAAIKAVYGTTFNYGPICSTIYKTTGSSVDYALDVTGADYSFTLELRDTGANGFVLPAAQILPSGVEAWAGLKYLLANMQ
ncbi:hypothetical protein QBC32DRAFT_234781 [Pseudoneurospora amorphoporcata]|uniref:Peptidase M14 domain-containing protein n=1 Tax=Pseudoneurospora amorphoporcata TaxID=241081 RepID=A0AAN6NWJ6_9PEZI|nr:hypothetical protein QBC32DRAFT_234781 [Pseudoneurospora amorphoporcata]